jgi:hypothetical protein
MGSCYSLFEGDAWPQDEDTVVQEDPHPSKHHDHDTGKLKKFIETKIQSMPRTSTDLPPLAPPVRRQGFFRRLPCRTGRSQRRRERSPNR